MKQILNELMNVIFTFYWISTTSIKHFEPLGKMLWSRLEKMLAPRKKTVTNLDSILKSIDITLPTKTHQVKAMFFFPVVMYGWENWTIKKAEQQRIDAFELWCWRRLLRVPWTARRINQSTLKEIHPECLLEGLILKLKLQFFGYLM